MEVATLQAHVVVGGGIEELRRLRAEVEELRERARFYQGRYYVAITVDRIEHYGWSTRLGTNGTHIGMQGGGDGGWSTGGESTGGS